MRYKFHIQYFKSKPEDGLYNPKIDHIIPYYIKNQQDATLAVLFISNCEITLLVSDAGSVRNM